MGPTAYGRSSPSATYRPMASANVTPKRGQRERPLRWNELEADSDAPRPTVGDILDELSPLPLPGHDDRPIHPGTEDSGPTLGDGNIRDKPGIGKPLATANWAAGQYP